jgi:hypothetical protein
LFLTIFRTQLLASILTDRFLHREIREKGGAYGGGAYQNSQDGYFGFMSYRDPNCDHTVEIFEQAIDWICSPSTPINQRELDEALLSVVASIDKYGTFAFQRIFFHTLAHQYEVVIGMLHRPLAPSAVGQQRFTRGISHQHRIQFRSRLLKVTIEDIVDAAKRHLQACIRSIFCCFDDWSVLVLNL